MIAVTAAHKVPEEIVRLAEERAAALGLPYMERQPNLETMGKDGPDAFLVYGRRGPALLSRGASHTFHTGTAKLRILAMRRGGEDRLCRLLPEGTRTVLDATFGEGKDSLVLSWYLGEKGRVTALEKSPALWEIGRWGIERFEDREPDVTAALRRIRLVRADFREFLKNAISEKRARCRVGRDLLRHHVPPPREIDTMFRRPVKREENNREAFRSGACYDLLDEDILREAARAAGKRVIVKERPFSALFRCGLFTAADARRGQTVAYGVIDTEKKEGER